MSRRERLIVDHLPMVRRLARRLARDGQDVDDLEQVGAIGLINAADRYEAGRGTRFAAYAEPCVEGEIKRHLRDRGDVVRVPRRVRAERAAVASAERELTGRLGREPTGTELAARAGVERDDLPARRGPIGCVSLDLPGVEVAAPEGDWDATDTRVAVERALDRLNARDRDVIQWRFFEDRGQAEIASDLGVSQPQVSRMISAALQRLREELDERVVVPARIGAYR